MWFQWVVIPKFAQDLPMLFETHEKYIQEEQATRSETGADIMTLSFESFGLIEALHSRGINVRYLGIVYTFLTPRKHQRIASRDNCLALLLLEMVVRTLKLDLRKRLRRCMQKLKEPLDEPFHRLVVNYLNVVFGSSTESTHFWETKLMQDVEAKFDGAKFPKIEGHFPFKDFTAYVIAMVMVMPIASAR